jgi:hypothetical protein
VDAPEVVVGEFLGARHLERRHGTALGVERLHDLVDGPVLARGIDSLEDDEDRALALGPEPVLEVPEAVELFRQGGRCRLLVPAEGLAVVAALEADT